jgi:hypothetical protein
MRTHYTACWSRRAFLRGLTLAGTTGCAACDPGPSRRSHRQRRQGFVWIMSSPAVSLPSVCQKTSTRTSG